MVIDKARHRRGTKGNQFANGERVRFKVGGDMGHVVEKDCTEQNWQGTRGYAPVSYLVELENGTTEWGTARELESIDDRHGEIGGD